MAMAQSKAPGFVSRQTYTLSDPTKITTLVVWDSNDIYDQWRASPERAVAMKGRCPVVETARRRALRGGVTADIRR